MDHPVASVEASKSFSRISQEASEISIIKARLGHYYRALPTIERLVVIFPQPPWFRGYRLASRIG